MNPWLQLPESAPYVLAEDALHIEAYNKSASPDYEIHTELLPEPFSGDLDAPIVVLLLNPGYSKDDLATHLRPDFRAGLRSVLQQKERIHHLLDTKSTGPGADWWKKRTRKLREFCTADSIAKRFLAVQYFPYHSRQYAHSSVFLPSQNFAFEIVRNAMDRGAFIICTRAKRLWCAKVPGLAAYPKMVSLKNPRSVFFTPGNMEKFEELIALLRENPT